MRNTKFSFFLAIFVLSFCIFSFADEVSDAVNQYYMTLAKMLNKNMDDPQKAQAEISIFIRHNVNWINGVRQMRDEKKNQGQSLGLNLMSSSSSGEREDLIGVDEFNKVMKEFKNKHPGSAHKLELLGVNAILKPL